MPLGKTLIVSLIATALLGTVAAAVALGPSAPDAVVEPASARQVDDPADGDAMEFMMGGRATIRLGFALEEAQDVRIRLVLTRGETTDLLIDGPGDCDNVLRGANAGDGRSVSLVCALPAGDHVVELSHRAGQVWGTLAATPLLPEGASGEAHVERITGKDERGVSATLPWPTCPLDCKMRYGRGGSSMDDFEVREGATRVVVTATWAAQHPADSYDVSLQRFLEEKDGGRYYEAVGGESGVGTVTFELADLPAGVYGLWSMVSAPAGVEVLRTIEYVVEVHYG